MDSTAISAVFARASRTYGVVASVARRLGFSHELVRLVALGRRNNEKVRRALLSELRRRERQASRERVA